MFDTLKSIWRWLFRASSGSSEEIGPRFSVGTRFRVQAGVAAEALGEELVLVHLGRGGTFRLNRTGKRVWELAGAGRTVAEMVVEMQAQWGVSSQCLEADVGRVLADLVREHLLEPLTEDAA